MSSNPDRTVDVADRGYLQRWWTMALSSWRYEIAMFLAVNTSFLVLFDTFSADRDTGRIAPMRPGPPRLDSRRRLMDLNGFEYVIDSGACDGPRRHTPVVVHSHVGHFERRRAIRQSYTRTVLDRLGFRHVFMVGLPSSGNGVDDRSNIIYLY